MKILFVRLGNICRSPIAEGVMKKLAKDYELDWEINSASTNTYHTGERPHKSSQKVCRENGIDIANQRAQRITKHDMQYYDHIYVMATDVAEDIKQIVGHEYDPNKVSLFLETLYPGEAMDVPDPWYGTEAGFYPVYDLIYKGCEAIIQKYAPKK